MAGRSYEPLRDNKSSIYEGGHREPFVARWPGKIKPGSTSDQVICLNDLFATCAEILAGFASRCGGGQRKHIAGIIRQGQGPIREATVHQAPAGLAIRQGDWKLIALRNGTKELYNLKDDLSETRNLIDTRKDQGEKAGGTSRVI